MKHHYTKKLIQEAIKYWENKLMQMNESNATVDEIKVTPDVLDEIYGKRIYDTGNVEFYTDGEGSTEKVPLKKLINKDRFYKLLIQKLEDVEIEDDVPNKIEIDTALDLAFDEIRDEEFARIDKELKYYLDEYRFNDYELRNMD